MTVTNATIREHVDTDMSNAALDRLIADAVAAIQERTGASGEQTVTLRHEGRYIFLPQPITDEADIDSITERWLNTDVELETDQWRWIGGRQIERLLGGGSIATTDWGWQRGWPDVDVVVTYTPRLDAARRDRVTIDLVRLAIQYNALGSERAGDYASSSKEYQLERDRIINELVAPVGFA